MSKGRLAAAAILLALVAAFFAAGGHEALTLANLKAHYGVLQAHRAAQPILTAAAFFALYVMVATTSVPGGAVLTMVAGGLFGVLAGVVIVSFASSLGALFAMLLSRYVFCDWVHERFGARLRKLDEGVERDGALYLFMVRLVPAIPFFLVNVGMGLTRMPAWRYYWVSQLGMLPGTCIFGLAGRRIAEIESSREVLSIEVVGALVLLALVAFLFLKRRSASPR